MKAYTYTAKDGAGAIKRGVLQAADRGTALAALCFTSYEVVER